MENFMDCAQVQQRSELTTEIDELRSARNQRDHYILQLFELCNGVKKPELIKSGENYPLDSAAERKGKIFELRHEVVEVQKSNERLSAIVNTLQSLIG